MLNIKELPFQNKIGLSPLLAQLLLPLNIINPLPMQCDSTSVVKQHIITRHLLNSNFIGKFSLVAFCLAMSAMMSCNNLYSEQQKKLDAQAAKDSTAKKDSIASAARLTLD